MATAARPWRAARRRRHRWREQHRSRAQQTEAASRIVSTARANFLPLGLAAGAAAGFLAPAPFAQLEALGFIRSAIALVFFLSGLNLRWADVAAALACPGALVFGCASTLLVSPLLGSAYAFSLPLLPRELKLGLAVFACVPTTLSSGAALAFQAGGNNALSVLLLVLTNVLGVLTMPTIVPFVFTSQSSLSMSPLGFLLDLCRTVLIPLFIGRTLSALSSRTASFASANKPRFSAISNVCIILTVAMQMSKAAGKVQGAVSLNSLVGLVLASVVLHLSFLAMNMSACYLLNFGGNDLETRNGVQRTLIILCSQKTLPVCVSVVNVLAPVVNAAPGLLVLPCVLSHLLQNLIDAVLVSHWRSREAMLEVG
jgi:sodium/bile acid cotransporter 7